MSIITFKGVRFRWVLIAFILGILLGISGSSLYFTARLHNNKHRIDSLIQRMRSIETRSTNLTRELEKERINSAELRKGLEREANENRQLIEQIKGLRNTLNSVGTGINSAERRVERIENILRTIQARSPTKNY